MPTGDVGTVTWDLVCGWNILQEFVWLPTPRFQLFMGASDTLALSLLNTDALTIGCSVIWEEFGNA